MYCINCVKTNILFKVKDRQSQSFNLLIIFSNIHESVEVSCIYLELHLWTIFIVIIFLAVIIIRSPIIERLFTIIIPVNVYELRAEREWN